MIACPKCQHDNDLGRIFCVKCGEKLDISKVTVPGGGKRSRKKKSKPLDKQIAIFTGKMIKVTILAAACAFLTLVWLPPRFASKEFSGKNYTAYMEKRGKLEEAVDNQEVVELTFDEGDLNAAMAQIVQQTVEGAPEAKGFKLESIYIEPKEGQVLITIQNKYKYFRLNLQVYAKPDNKTGKWDFTTSRLLIGRMPIPQQLHSKLNEAFLNRLWAGFATEKQWIEQLDAFDSKPGEITLKTKKES